LYSVIHLVPKEENVRRLAMTTIKPDPDVINHFENLMSFDPELFEHFSCVISEDTGSTKLLLQRKTSRYPSSYKYSNRFCQICDFVYDRERERDVNAAKNITGVLIWQFQNDRTTNKTRPDYPRRMKRVAPIT